VVLHAINIPLAWIHNLPREEAGKLAMELGFPVYVTLDELRKRLKEKWKALETYVPLQNTDNSEVAMHTAGVGDIKVHYGDMHDHVSYSQPKLRGKMATDLVKLYRYCLLRSQRVCLTFLSEREKSMT
jgi:hypothetical protein